jgi:hypothetical protein
VKETMAPFQILVALTSIGAGMIFEGGDAVGDAEGSGDGEASGDGEGFADGSGDGSGEGESSAIFSGKLITLTTGAQAV